MRKDLVHPPFFISFEGGEGVGKTTLIERCADALALEGVKVIKTREPGGVTLAEHIRGWLLNQDFGISIGCKAELLLFLASRAQHLEELIEPSLKAGKIVLCDRFNDSTIVYQGIARGLGKDYVEKLCLLVCGSTVPSLTFFLDLEPELGLKRTLRLQKEHAREGIGDRIESESLQFHRQVREGFLQLAKENPGRIHILNANQTADQVFDQVWSILKCLIGL